MSILDTTHFSKTNFYYFERKMWVHLTESVVVISGILMDGYNNQPIYQREETEQIQITMYTDV